MLSGIMIGWAGMAFLGVTIYALGLGPVYGPETAWSNPFYPWVVLLANVLVGGLIAMGLVLAPLVAVAGWRELFPKEDEK